MMVVGITGPTGAGKSIVCRLLGEWERISVIDCDQVSRQVVRRGQRCLLDLAVEFSSAIVDKDGELNRRKLASIVFADRRKLKRMESIIYPYILAIRWPSGRRRGTGRCSWTPPPFTKAGRISSASGWWRCWRRRRTACAGSWSGTV